jgi:hAT family C-terminal dimerisation region
MKNSPENPSQEDDDDTATDDKDDEENVSNCDFQLWTDYSYVKPLRVIDQFSAYPMLTAMYKILLSIAVISCSAERILSRARIIKNLLRSTMQDE